MPRLRFSVTLSGSLECDHPEEAPDILNEIGLRIVPSKYPGFRGDVNINHLRITCNGALQEDVHEYEDGELSTEPRS